MRPPYARRTVYGPLLYCHGDYMKLYSTFYGAVKPLRGTTNERTPRPGRMVMQLVAVQQIRQRGKRQIVYPRTLSTRHAMFSLQNLGCFVLWIRRAVEECRGQEQEAFERLPLISAPRHGPALSAANPESGGFLREFRWRIPTVMRNSASVSCCAHNLNGRLRHASRTSAP